MYMWWRVLYLAMEDVLPWSDKISISWIWFINNRNNMHQKRKGSEYDGKSRYHSKRMKMVKSHCVSVPLRSKPDLIQEIEYWCLIPTTAGKWLTKEWPCWSHVGRCRTRINIYFSTNVILFNERILGYVIWIRECYSSRFGIMMSC